MLKNYLTVAVRNILKNGLYSAINVFGLSVGIASCILIVLFVRNELSYDRWLPDAGRIYQLHTRFDVPGRAPFIGAASPGIALPMLEKDFGQIETGTRMLRQRPVVKRGAEVFRENVMLVDPSFFDVFQLPLVSGNRAAALSDASALWVSESMARKYFGSAPAVGQILPMTFFFGKHDYQVAGVFKDLPSNTHLDIDFLAPINEGDFEKMPWMLRSWVSTNGWTYIKLKPGADVDNLRAGLKQFERQNVPDLTFGDENFKTADLMTLSLMKLTDVHLHAPPLGDMRPVGDPRSIATFTIVAAMILLIACINFTNLATARAGQRAREVALRKVVGAKRSQLVVQFLIESLLTALLAFAVSLVMVEASLPLYNTILQRQLTLNPLADGEVLAAMAGLIVVVGLAAGVYPALVLSGFLPARILKANKSAAAEGSGRLRTVLVILQFAVSIGLLACTAVVYGQTVYARTMNLGYDRNGLLVVRAPYGDQYAGLRSTLRSEVARIPGVKAVTISADVPTDDNESNNVIEIPGRPSPTPILLEERDVDYDFFTAYRIPLLAGRYLDESHGGDDYTGTDDEKIRRGGAVVINQQALGRLGFASAGDAIGKTLRIGVNTEKSSQATVTIVGVVGDIFYRSVRDALAPTFFIRDAQNFAQITLRYDGVAGPAVRDAMGKVWHSLAPDQPYKAEFFDALVAAQYQAEEAEAKLFGVFSLLAVVIGCLGLYGLAAFTAERRTKEIGIRKVLGAKVFDLVKLLVVDFSKPVVIANLLAWPVAWMLMRNWLDGFQYRIALSPLIFAAAGLLALMIAWATVAGHAARAARANPIKALRYE